MRLAWCRSTTDLSDRLDDTAALITALRSRHDITCVDRTSMHDLVRAAFRHPFDLHVYELADSDDHAFIWPYVLHYPGIVRLRSASLHHSRATMLARQNRHDDRRAELAFGRGDLTVAPLLASRMVVVADAHHAASLQREVPDARVRIAPIGWGADPGEAPRRHEGLIPVGVLGHPRKDTITHAVQRARESGARIELMSDASPDRVLRDAGIVLVLPWPPRSDMTPAIAAFSHGRPVVMFETESSAGWPALDPQTWRPRIGAPDAPIAITIDPRDEEHSLSLALRRLSADATLRDELGAAARHWWRGGATVAHAVDRWEAILGEAVSLPAPTPAAHWPPHLTADGTEHARAILNDFGVDVDFLR
jgi:hypothetical protein